MIAMYGKDGETHIIVPILEVGNPVGSKQWLSTFLEIGLSKPQGGELRRS